MEIFAERLKTMRLERKLTQDELAKQTKISQATLSFYEQNINSPNAENIVVLCKFFNVSADYLLGLQE